MAECGACTDHKVHRPGRIGLCAGSDTDRLDRSDAAARVDTLIHQRVSYFDLQDLLTIASMPHAVSLITTVAAGLGLAMILGYIAARLRMPPLVGYLLAGIAIGPAHAGVRRRRGTRRSARRDRRDVAHVRRRPALLAGRSARGETHRRAWRRRADRGRHGPGRRQSRIWWGWAPGAALVFGLALSVASTVVLLRALEARGVLDSVNGRIAVGWLVVEDLVMVLVLVLLPPLAGMLGGHRLRRARQPLGSPWAMTLAKGRRVRGAHAGGGQTALPEDPLGGRRAPARASCSPCA
jgi:hypothetical protein